MKGVIGLLVKNKKEISLLTLAVLQVGLMSGIIFGWAGFVPILESEGIYANLCSQDQKERPCPDQILRYSVVYSVGSFSNIASPILTGMFLDRFGPKLTNVTSGFLFSVGVLVLLLSFRFQVDIFAPGYGLLGFAGPGVQLSMFHISNLFPSYQATVLSIISALYNISSIVFRVMYLVYSSGVSVESIFIVFLIILAVLILPGVWIWPNKPYALPKEHAEEHSHIKENPVQESSLENPELEAKFDDHSVNVENVAIISSDKIQDPSHEYESINVSPLVQAPSPFEVLHRAPLRHQLSHPLFWLQTLWISIIAFQSVFYAGNIQNMFHSSVRDHYSSVFNWIWSCSFVFVPVIGVFIDKKGLPVSLCVTTIAQFFFQIFSCVPNNPLQYVTFLLAAFASVASWSIQFSFLAEVFGFINFGKLLGVSSGTVAVISLLQTPLVSLVYNHLNESFFFVQLVGAMLVVFLLPLPLYYNKYFSTRYK